MFNSSYMFRNCHTLIKLPTRWSTTYALVYRATTCMHL